MRACYPNMMWRKAITAAETTAKLPVLPPSLGGDSSLFLDLDGTLVDLIDRPDEVRADAQLRATLLAVHRRLEGRLAIVSGRSLAQLDEILGEVAQQLGLSGSHGTEYRWQGVEESPQRPAALDAAREEFVKFAAAHDAVLLEDKSFGVALHYRIFPQIEAHARTLAAQLSHELGLFLQEGKMMVELRPSGHDKGGAIRHLMGKPALDGSVPVFVGDDVTDEHGFEAAAAMGGYGILVGAPRLSAAHYNLSNPDAVRNWLEELLL